MSSLNVGGLYAELSIDATKFTQGLQQSRQALALMSTDIGAQIRDYAQLKAAAEKSVAEVAQAHKKSAEAAEKAAKAEQEVTRARSSGNIDAMIRAEARRAQALEESERAAGEAARATARMDEALGRVGNAIREVRFDRMTRDAREAAQATERIDVPSGLAQRIQQASQELSDLGQNAAGAADSGSEMGESFVGGFAGRLGDLGGKGGPIAAALAGVAAVGLAAGQALAQAIRDGMEKEQNLDLFAARTRTTEEQARRLGQAAADAYTANFGESVEANLDTLKLSVQTGILNRDAAQADAEAVVAVLNTVTDAFEGDMETSVKAVSSLINSGLARDAAEAADMLSAAAGGSANRAGDLLEVVDEYASGWKNAGVSGVQALALIEQATANGSWNSDAPADALREWGRRMSEESEDVIAAMDDIGLNGQQMFDTMKAGGDEGAAAFDKLMDTVRGIEDPLKRNQAIAALLGDTAGDFYDVFAQFDPSAAVSGLGEVEGATMRLADQMASNGAAKVESAFRTIETAADDVKLALGEAFGPHGGEFADWVTEHKAELIQFFVDLTDGALLCGEGIARFVSMSIDVVGPFAAIMSEAFASALDTMGTFVGAAAEVADAIGLDGMASDLRGAAGFLDEYSTKAQNSADMMLQFGDVLDNDVIPALGGIREGVRSAGEQAANSELLMRSLGTAVVEGIPDDKTIQISDNSPDTIERLRLLGLKVVETPSGIHVTADTREGEEIITDFIERERTATVTLAFRQDQQSYWRAMGAANPDQVAGPVPYPLGTSPGASSGGGFADGKLPDEALIASGRGAGLVQWAEGETEGEAFIPLAPSKRARSLAILAETAARMGVIVARPQSYADGGITEDARQAAIAFARSKDDLPYVYTGASGDSWDCSGYQSGIYNKLTGKSVRFTTDSDFAALGFAPGYDPNGYSIGTNGGTGENGHMAGTLYGVNVESGASNGVQYGGPALGAQDFPMVWHLPGATMQPQSKGGDDPSTERIGNLEKELEVAKAAESSATTEEERQKAGTKVAALQAELDQARAASSTTLSNTYNVSTTGGVQDVRVMNWPDGLLDPAPLPPVDDEKMPPAGRGHGFALAYYRDGGVEDHSAQIASAGSWRVWAEEETGGEAYIPLSPSKRARSTSILRQVAHRFGMQLMADGSFMAPNDPAFETGGSKHHDTVQAWLGSDAGGTASLSTIDQANPADVAAQNAYRAGVGIFGGAMALVDLIQGLMGGGVIGTGIDLAENIRKAIEDKAKEQATPGGKPLGNPAPAPDATKVGAQFYGPVTITDPEGFIKDQLRAARAAHGV